MAGWNLTHGELNLEKINEDHYWSLFNYVFSESSKKRSTYKFGLIKSLLDNVFSMDTVNFDCLSLSYYSIFSRFISRLVACSLKVISHLPSDESSR